MSRFWQESHARLCQTLEPLDDSLSRTRTTIWSVLDHQNTLGTEALPKA